MKEKNNHFIQTIFNPQRLKEFKTENFSIRANQRANRKSASVSFINNKYSILVRNPTNNFLYKRININKLVRVKFLLEKSFLNENSVSNSINHTSFNKKNNINNNYSNSFEYIKNENFKKVKYFKYCQDNHLINTKGNNSNNEYKNRLYKLDHNLYLVQNKLNNRIKENLKDKNSNKCSSITDIRKNKNLSQSIKKTKISNYNLLDKIIFIQSFWRSYYLRKTLTGGLEKYYSSIAITQYINNFIYNNKKVLFHYFIESIKEFILSKKFKNLNGKITKNNINEYFSENDESFNSLGIPKDKKNDCIYFFINSEKTKNNNNKNNIKNNGLYENHSKSNIINKKNYNFKCCKKYKDNDDIKMMYYKKPYKYIKSQNFHKNINIKINLLKNNNAKNELLRYLGTDVSFHKKKDKKLINQKLYVKKKFNEISSNNNSKSNSSSNKTKCFTYETFSPLLNAKGKNFIILNSFMNMIKRKYLLLFFSLFKININSRKINVFKNHKSNSEMNVNFFHKENKSNKSIEINEYYKIKVNKNNNIEKSKRVKLIKKILGKKFNEHFKKNILSLKKYFYIWKRHNFNKSATFAHFHPKQNINKANIVENLNINPIQVISRREKTINSSLKKHIKIKYKKSLTSFNTISSKSFDRKNMSFKKMKIIKKLIEHYNSFSSLSSSNLINNNNYKTKIFNQINKDIFIKKIFSIVNKLELKSKLFKHFHHWKKKLKK